MELITSLAMLGANGNGINNATFVAVNSIAGPALNALMHYLAESFYIVLPVIALYMIARRDRSVYSFVVAAIILFAVGYSLKAVFHQPRPCALPQYSWINAYPSCESGYSFPSDHAVTLTGLIFFVWRRKNVRWLYVIWLALVMFSRFYLGQHYLTDVVAGMAISLAIGYIIHRLSGRIFEVAALLKLDWITERGHAHHKHKT
ncbi:MAG: phosphatase PAP2 family protein [Candidatus Micrarchaeota archaeon]|nr:phosphatase PAP2 family protein [Candidatus Micrarchaeota archaeon]